MSISVGAVEISQITLNAEGRHTHETVFGMSELTEMG